VKAHYTGTLEDGSKFDSSVDRGQVFSFTIGQGQVIKGWDQGFATMKKGEKAVLKCRSDYAYGKHLPRIEATLPCLRNATLAATNKPFFGLVQKQANEAVLPRSLLTPLCTLRLS
jgi:FKBP-type peptidyl-prolyl cis-trans isomerase 2